VSWKSSRRAVQQAVVSIQPLCPGGDRLVSRGRHINSFVVNGRRKIHSARDPLGLRIIYGTCRQKPVAV